MFEWQQHNSATCSGVTPDLHRSKCLPVPTLLPYFASHSCDSLWWVIQRFCWEPSSCTHDARSRTVSSGASCCKGWDVLPMCSEPGSPALHRTALLVTSSSSVIWGDPILLWREHVPMSQEESISSSALINVQAYTAFSMNLLVVLQYIINLRQ